MLHVSTCKNDDLKKMLDAEYAEGFYSFDDVAQTLGKRVVLREFHDEESSAVTDSESLETVLKNTHESVKSQFTNVDKRMQRRMKANQKKAMKTVMKREKAAMKKTNKVAPASSVHAPAPATTAPDAAA